MKKTFAVLFLMVVATPAAKAQRPAYDDQTTIKESGYFIGPSLGGYITNVAVLVSNPYDNRFASRPKVQVTLRAADGSIIATRELDGAGIPPRGTIALCETFRADERPAKVDIRPLSASYEATEFKPIEFRPHTLSNLRVREDGRQYMTVTGEVGHPYSKDAGAWICLLFRNKQGKLLGGHNHWKSEVPAGEPIPFEMRIRIDELPANVGSIDKLVFSHNNYQESWRELLRK